MKKKIFILAVLAALPAMLLVNGCKKNDTTPPVVTLNGSASMTISLNSTFTDPGAKANDDEDGDVSSSIKVTGTVDNNTKGSYTLTYSANDKAGNVGTATRVVTVANDAEGWSGNYAVHDSVVSDTVFNYHINISTDAHVDNRIHFNVDPPDSVGFADYINNTTIYANITGGGTTIDLPSQTVTGIGHSPLDNHTFSGTGTQSGNNFNLNYTDNNTTTSSVANDISTWTRQ